MVGIFSRFSAGRDPHRRTQSAVDDRESLPPKSDSAAVKTATAVSHGIEVAVEFKPVEHPVEPLDIDQPIQCPLPEPSILNDGRMWKERVSASVRRRGDLSAIKDGAGVDKSDSDGFRLPRGPAQANRMILPSLSAPEHHLLNLLEEYNASGV